MCTFRSVACVACVACASWAASACRGSGGGGGGEIICGETEPVAVSCPAGITASSGPQTYRAALAETTCGRALADDCGTYLRVFDTVSLGSWSIYYYDEIGDTLVAVVQRADVFGDTCIAGPADFVEPCDQSCTPLDAGTTPVCSDAGDGGESGG